MRDDFTLRTKEALAERVGYRCSNPGCRQPTSGPRSDPAKSINVGVAAHISAASAGGPRYDRSLNSEQRNGADNGIWLCENCAKLIDNDENRYTPHVLHQWKTQAERQALRDIERPSQNSRKGDSVHGAILTKLEQLMPDLLGEIRDDLTQNPLYREFVLLKRGWAFNTKDQILAYYFDDHPELKNQVLILENHGLIMDVSRSNVDRYRMTEAFVECLVG